MDYAVPNYRDNKNGEYIYNAETKFLKEQGITKMTTTSEVKAHIKYLKNIGFENLDNSENKFFKII